MIFSLDVRRARKGDCLLLHFGSEDEPGLVMIDGGPGNVYKPHLRPRLLEIKKARGLEKNDPLARESIDGQPCRRRSYPRHSRFDRVR